MSIGIYGVVKNKRTGKEVEEHLLEAGASWYKKDLFKALPQTRRLYSELRPDSPDYQRLQRAKVTPRLRKSLEKKAGIWANEEPSKGEFFPAAEAKFTGNYVRKPAHNMFDWIRRKEKTKRPEEELEFRIGL